MEKCTKVANIWRKMIYVYFLKILQNIKIVLKRVLARVCGVIVGRRLGGRLSTMIVATINDILFFLFSFLSLYIFLKEGVL